MLRDGHEPGGQHRLDERCAERRHGGGAEPKARSPITVLAGSSKQSSTGASPESKPAARSSRAIALATAAARRGSPVRPMVAAGGNRVNGGGRR
jgi:hypothetical protein